MNVRAQIGAGDMLTIVKVFLLGLPGANYVLIAWAFVVRFWKPIALASALAFAFYSGVKHERKKSQVDALKATIVRLAFERDNLKTAGEAASKKAEELDAEVKATQEKINALLSKPVAGDCTLSDDVRQRLRVIGR